KGQTTTLCTSSETLHGNSDGRDPASVLYALDEVDNVVDLLASRLEIRHLGVPTEQVAGKLPSQFSKRTQHPERPEGGRGRIFACVRERDSVTNGAVRLGDAPTAKLAFAVGRECGSGYDPGRYRNDQCFRLKCHLVEPAGRRVESVAPAVLIRLRANASAATTSSTVTCGKRR